MTSNGKTLIFGLFAPLLRVAIEVIRSFSRQWFICDHEFLYSRANGNVGAFSRFRRAKDTVVEEPRSAPAKS